MVSTPGRIVLITGAASGIGLATAARCASAGDNVVATVRSRDRAGALETALAGHAGCEVLELDVTTDDAEAVVTDVVTRHGALDVVVNNAGLSVEGGLEDLGLDGLRRSMDVNFFGAARVTLAALPTMRTAGRGHLIAVSSVMGVRGMAFSEAYAASKFALEGLYESMAPVMAMFGVHLTLVEPGPVSGEFITKPTATVSGPSAPYEDMYERFVAMRAQAYEGCPTPDDIADVIHRVSTLETPPLRVQDSAESTALVAGKLADLDGSHVMEGKRLFTRARRD